MNALFDRIRREPALVTGFTAAVIALAVAFGLDLTGEQTGAIMALVTAVLGFVTRAKVTPAPKRRTDDGLHY